MKIGVRATIQQMNDARVIEESEDSISVSCGLTRWVYRSGERYVEKDYRVGGEVWRVNKYDADPFPSSPHAHCIDGRARFVGCKLHLGTRQLFSPKNDPLDRFLDEKQFDSLISLIRRKFPEIKLPLTS